jgi:hypothetical protein
MAFFTSVPAGLVWIGVLLLLARWAIAAATGHLTPGSQSSWAGLTLLFLIALSAAIAGCYATVQALSGRSSPRWQLASLAAAFFTLWAVSGD